MCEKLFDKVFCKSVSYKVITPDTADHSESQYSKFVTTVVKKKSAIIFKLFKEWPTFGPIYDEICWNIYEVF